MKRGKTYTVSDKVLKARYKMTDFDKVIFTLTQRNQSWTFQQIADALCETRQCSQQRFKRFKKYTLDDLNKLLVDMNQDKIYK